ncbi:SRPBCC family protein [Streptomyces sp. CAU 1734]|uniref:aromatase/cyclase n=1 Tax=Streptomyces sp. CAU 1734 TaxID=3140360 RepID=UPI0032603E00
MSPAATRHHTRETRVSAPAADVHRLLAAEDNWPRIFAPFIHLENLGPRDGGDRIGMWTHSGDTIEHFTAVRHTDPDALRVAFRPDNPPPHLESMLRTWVTVPLSPTECLLRLEHDYRPAPGAAPDADDALTATLDTIARTETAAVRAAAELGPLALVTVEDTVTVPAPADRVHTALFDAAGWPAFMDHVLRAETLPGGPAHTHILDMETAEARGGTFTTRTARIALPGRKIAYKQLLLPPLGASHHVQWHLEDHDGGRATTVRSVQTVVIKEDGVAAVLGPDTGIEAARGFIRAELSTKARLILDATARRFTAAPTP